MGKNQAYKAMQRAKMGTSTAAGGPGEEIDDGMVCILPRLILIVVSALAFSWGIDSWLLNGLSVLTLCAEEGISGAHYNAGDMVEQRKFF